MWSLLNGRIHPQGYVFIALFAGATFFLSFVHPWLGWGGVLLTLWCVFFFRDPHRTPPVLENALVAPADGVILSIATAPLPPEIQQDSYQKWQETTWTRISIFLNIFDVHVNRIPLSGRVLQVVYHPGKFFNASLDKASDFNERNTLLVQNPDGETVVVVQIAGLIARRIVCHVHEDQQVERGERFGMIRFGSRTDVYVPSHFLLHVVQGQRTIGGETVLGVFPTKGIAL